MENLLLEQYSLYKKQQLAESPFKCLLNADIEPNPSFENWRNNSGGRGWFRKDY